MYRYLEEVFNFGLMDRAHSKTLGDCSFEVLSETIIKVSHKKEVFFIYVFKMKGADKDSVSMKDGGIKDMELEYGFFEYSFKYTMDVHGAMSKINAEGVLVNEIERRIESLNKPFFQYHRCFYIASKTQIEKPVFIELIKKMKLRVTLFKKEDLEILIDRWFMGKKLESKDGLIVKDGKRKFVKLLFNGSSCDSFIQLKNIDTPTEFFSICKFRNKIVGGESHNICKKHVLIDVSDISDNKTEMEYFSNTIRETHRGCDFDIDSSSSYMDAMPGSTLNWFIPAYRHLAFYEERVERIRLGDMDASMACVNDEDDFLKIGTDGSGRAFDLKDSGGSVVWRDLHAGRCMLIQEIHNELSSGKKVVIKDFEGFTDYTVLNIFGICSDLRGVGFQKDRLSASNYIFIVNWNENVDEIKWELGGDFFVFGCGLPHQFSVKDYKEKGCVDRLHVRVASASKSDRDGAFEVVGLGEGKFIDKSVTSVIALNLIFNGREIETPLSKTFAKIGNANPNDIDIILKKVGNGQKLMTMIDRQLGDVFG